MSSALAGLDDGVAGAVVEHAHQRLCLHRGLHRQPVVRIKCVPAVSREHSVSTLRCQLRY